MNISLWQAHVQWKKNGQAGMSRQYMYVKCTLACWAGYKCLLNAPWLVRQNRHEYKMDPELLGGIYIYAKCTLACWAEYTYVQKGP